MPATLAPPHYSECVVLPFARRFLFKFSNKQFQRILSHLTGGLALYQYCAPFNYV